MEPFHLTCESFSRSSDTANLASFLVSRNRLEFPISTVEDAIERGAPICVQRGAVLDDILSTKHPELKVVRKQTEQEIFQALKLSWFGGKGGCAAGVTNFFTFEIYQRQTATNADCSLTSEKRVYLTLPSGFATAVDSGTMCTSLVSHVLDLYFTEMKADGFIDQAWQDHLSKVSQVSCPDEAPAGPIDIETTSLGPKEMAGIFICHLFLTGIALFVAFFQYFHARKTKPKDSLRPVFRKSSNPFDEASAGPVNGEDSGSQTCSEPFTLQNTEHDNSQRWSSRNMVDRFGGNEELQLFDAGENYYNEDDTPQRFDAGDASDNSEDNKSMEAHEKFFLGNA